MDYSTLTDEELVTLGKTDPNAVASFLERRASLRRFLFNLQTKGLPYNVKQEMWSENLLGCLEGIQKFDPNGKLKATTKVFGRARTRLNNSIHMSAKHKDCVAADFNYSAEEGDEEAWDLTDPAPSPEDAVWHRQIREAILDALESLTGKEREIFARVLEKNDPRPLELPTPTCQKLRSKLKAHLSARLGLDDKGRLTN